MLVVQDPFRQTDLPRGCVATIGNFDGLHIGHQKIIHGVVERARELGLPSVVITFNPHPTAVLAPERAPSPILTLNQKRELIAAMGVDALLVVPFSHEFSLWPWRKFVDDLLVTGLAAKEVHIGRDFCFGAGREGTLDRLREAGEELGFRVVGIEDVRLRGVRVSSSIIRSGIRKGALRAVYEGLGRTYYVDGRVATGQRLGRRIGFPTVNLDSVNSLFPGSGVYVTTCYFESFSRSFESVTNIGVRPTLYENYAVTIESHILDFASDVYGDSVRLFFHALLRREKQFRSALELTNQIRDDIVRSRSWFLRHNPQVFLPSSLTE